jgi:signal transduction histidine kinase
MQIQDHLFFSLFSEQAAGCLAAAATVRDYAADEIVFHEGAPSDSVYLVLSGVVSITKNAGGAQEQVLAESRENDFFGEFGVIDGAARSATAIATGACCLARIPGDLVLESLRSADTLADLRFATRIIDKVRASNSKFIEELLARERLALVGQMVRGIVHDFRNPFSVITMAADFISLKCDDPEAREFCEMINEQIDRVGVMADEVLDFTKGKTEYHPRVFDMAWLLDRFSHTNRRYLKTLCVDFRVESSECLVRGDPNRLMRVLQNLVYNAAEVLPDGGLISIVQENRGDAVVLHVSDNGPGIPEELRDTLFDAFVTHGKKKGVGLGLAIAKSIVEAHSGTITFDTSMGQGTTFHVRLPVGV